MVAFAPRPRQVLDAPAELAAFPVVEGRLSFNREQLQDLRTKVGRAAFEASQVDGLIEDLDILRRTSALAEVDERDMKLLSPALTRFGVENLRYMTVTPFQLARAARHLSRRQAVRDVYRPLHEEYVWGQLDLLAQQPVTILQTHAMNIAKNKVVVSGTSYPEMSDSGQPEGYFAAIVDAGRRRQSVQVAYASGPEQIENLHDALDDLLV